MLWLPFLAMRMSSVHISALSSGISCWHSYLFCGQESRLRVQAKTMHTAIHLHWLIKILTQPEAIWDSMWPLCRGHSERKRHSLAHTDITDHYSYPGLSLMPPCLESCVWSWTDPGPALKPSNVLAAHHMGPSQGETRRVFPLPICLV